MPHNNQDIAIVGIGLRFPGASSVKEYAARLEECRDLSAPAPEQRWNVRREDSVSTEPRPDKVRSVRGYYLKSVPDPVSLGLPAGTDPVFTVSLDAARQAVSEVKILDIDHTGVIMAAIALPTDTTSELSERVLGGDLASRINKALKEYAAANPGAPKACQRTIEWKDKDSISLRGHREADSVNISPVGLPAQIIAQKLGLGLGGYTLDAACASSLAAVELACRELRSGRASAIIAGGLSRPDCLYTQMGFSALHALSPSGTCSPFDKKADGLMVGEGCGLLVLKRLADARRDGEKIYAVIKGAGLSNDIEGSLVAPSSEGQIRCLRAAYESCGLKPWDIDLIECHGTGTPVGDKVEFTSLCELWKDAPAGQICRLRSVKSMVGHLLTAAGAAGLIRVILNMNQGEITGQVNFSAAGIPLEGSHFEISAGNEAWPAREGAPRRAAVSGFGFGGINAHIILESCAEETEPGTAHADPAGNADKAGQAVQEPADSENNKNSDGADAPQAESTADNAAASAETASAAGDDAVAIVGISCILGSIDSLSAFEKAVFNGESILSRLPEDRWQGITADAKADSCTYIKEAAVPIGKFRIPPTDIPNILPQQSLLLQAAAKAMEDAGETIRQRRERAAAIIGIALDLNSTNFDLRWALSRQVPRWARTLGLSDSEAEKWLADLRSEVSQPLDSTRTMGALGSIAASRAARELQFGGCSFTVSAQEASGYEALKIGCDELLSGRLDMVLAGAVDLQGDIRSISALSADQAVLERGEGACCLVLKRLSDAQKAGNRVYCVIKGFGQTSETGEEKAAPGHALCQSIINACGNADVSSASLGLLELGTSKLAEGGSKDEISSLSSMFNGSEQSSALSSLADIAGECGAVSCCAALAGTALCLKEKLLPPTPGYISPDGTDRSESLSSSSTDHAAAVSADTQASSDPADASASYDARTNPLFVSRKPSFWFNSSSRGPRRAAASVSTSSGRVCTVILEEPPRTENEKRHRPEASAALLWTSFGSSPQEILREIKRLHDSAADSLLELQASGAEKAGSEGLTTGVIHESAVKCLQNLSLDWWEYQQTRSELPLALAFAIDLSSPEPVQEFFVRLTLAEKHLTDHADTELTNHSIFYSPAPLAAEGRTAFVYPGSGANFLGLGRELALQFPQIMDRLERENSHMADEFEARWNQPRRLDWSGSWQRDAFACLAEDSHKMMFSQVTFSMLTTDIVRSAGLEPSAAIGYSLGESAALLSLRAWPARDMLFERMSGSNLFREKLSGKCLSAREAWHIPADSPFEWTAALLPLPADKVRKAIAEVPGTRLLIVNTDTECVVGGTKDSVDELCKLLKAHSIKVSGVDTVHCDCLEPVAQEYWDMHHLPCDPPEGISFYSEYTNSAYELTSEAIADSIVAHGRYGFDYTKTIRQAWDDGIRIFLEMGPGASCTRMINKILEGKPHFAASVSVRGKSEMFSLCCMLAGAISQGLRPDLAAVLPERSECAAGQAANVRCVRVPLGRRPFNPPLPNLASAQENASGAGRADSDAAPAEHDTAQAAPCTPDSAVSEAPLAGIPVHTGAVPAAGTAQAFPAVSPCLSGIPSAEAVPAAAAAEPVTNTVIPAARIGSPQGTSMEKLSSVLTGMAANLQRSHLTWLEFASRSAQGLSLLAQQQSRLISMLGGNPYAAEQAASCSAPDSNAEAAAAMQTVSVSDIAAQAASVPESISETALAETAAIPASASSALQPAAKAPVSGYTHKLHGVESTTCEGYVCGFKPSLAPAGQKVFMDRDACLKFASGKIGDVLGPQFAPIDNYNTRVRLPDCPLMLVDRIISVEGEPLSLGKGRVITEHDVVPGMWYLDGGRAPVFISVEAGQADLFLCSWLGIDFKAKGKRVYRLLDANVRFHRGLPQPGETVRYDIRIKRFINQGDTWLFFFEYEGTIAGETFITMRDGCAGFFTKEEINNNGGLVLTEADLHPSAPVKGPEIRELVHQTARSYTLENVEALRRGDLEGCFGPDFAGLPLHNPVSLPAGLLCLIHRIPECDPNGGRWGLGMVVAEADVHPEDWYLTCHFVDDMVMPGTLMYECCAHALRFLLTSIGWVGESDKIAYEPVIGAKAELKCRGPVLQTTKTVRYQVEIKEIGYNPQPYVIADAIMYADNKRVVGFRNVSMQMTGTTGQELEAIWAARDASKGHTADLLSSANTAQTAAGMQVPGTDRQDGRRGDPVKPAFFDEEKFMQFAVGRPSLAFGPEFAKFDDRFLARLPGPPYQFVSRIVSTEHPFLKAVPGGWTEAQYDIPEDAWYFKAGHAPNMPFCILNEIALQVCGWVSSYAGSSMESSENLHYRNLGGTSRLYKEITPKTGTVTIRVRMTKSSEAGGLIIQSFDMQMTCRGEMLYEGTTTFGFFTEKALADQVGIRGAEKRIWVPENPLPFTKIEQHAPFAPDDAQCDQAHSLDLPGKALLMLDEYAWYPQGGHKGLGAVIGRKQTNPKEWFFTAHFFQDPVMPGSLGLEAFIQSLKIAALKIWPELADTHYFSAILPEEPHTWLYRGQVIRANKQTVLQVFITERRDGSEPVLKADGFLQTDGRTIYELKDFGIKLMRK